MFLAHSNWQEMETVLKKDELVVVVPLGSTEQHGPIGPLGTDFIIPEHLATAIAERTEILVTPTIPFGVASNHVSFPGTIDIGPDGLYLVMKGLLSSLMRHGARRFLFLNGHGGNDATLDKAGLEAYHQGALCAQVNWWALAPALNPKWTTGHGDAQEVAMIKAINPALVKDECLVPTHINNMSEKLTNVHLNQVRFQNATLKVIRDVRATVSTGGFGGLPSEQGTVEWGREMKAAVIDYCVDFIDEFKKVDLKKARCHA